LLDGLQHLPVQYLVLGDLRNGPEVLEHGVLMLVVENLDLALRPLSMFKVLLESDPPPTKWQFNLLAPGKWSQTIFPL